MNHVYRLVWSRSRRELVVASELAGSADAKSSQRRRRWISRAALVLAGQAAVVLLGLSSLPAIAAPSGGQVVSGQANIQQSGNTTTVDQTTQKAIIDWQQFGIGKNQTVDFNQPGADSVALNRVMGTSASDIYGHLNANGQVFLVNPNGIYFAPGSEVDVGGLVASTLNISNQNFLDGNYSFSGTSPNGVVNDGSIQVAPGGYVAFLGRSVTNDGSIETPGGTTALGAGGSVNLTFQGNQLLSFKVSRSALNAAAANGGVISAKGGRVILSAQAKDALMQTVVNNTGVIQAQGVSDKGGVIKLLGGNSGTTQVSGTLDASSSDGGKGGTIETSGEHVSIGKATVDPGPGGSWLIDPVDLNIGSNAATTIDATLNSGGNVTEQTTSNSASGSGSTSSGPGDININAPISWSGSGTLSLDAYHSINLNASISITGSNGGLDLNYGATGALNLNGNAINLAYATDSLSINGNAYTVIDSFSNLSTMSSASGGYYALGTNVNGGGAYETNNLVTGTFDGDLNGLGHTLSSIFMENKVTDLGIFSKIGPSGVIENLNLTGINVFDENMYGQMGYIAGALAGSNQGLISHVNLTGSYSNNQTTEVSIVGGTTSGAYVGGLVGRNSGIVNDVTVYYANIGGDGEYSGIIVGYNSGTIENSRVLGRSNTNSSGFVYPTVQIYGESDVGGLAGYNASGATISDSYSVDPFILGSNLGVAGIAGANAGLIDDSYSINDQSWAGIYMNPTSNTPSGYIAGVAGMNYGQIVDSYSESDIQSSNTSNVEFAGLAALNLGTINDSYSKSVITLSGTSGSMIGGLVADNAGTIKNSYAMKSSSGSATGLTGSNTGTITDGYWFTSNTNAAEQQSSYSGFDFSGSNAPWTIYQGHTTALLTTFMMPLTINAANQTQDYTGQPSTATLQSPAYSVSGAPSSGNLFGLSQPYAQAINDGTYLPELWSDQQGYLIQYQNSVLTIVTPLPPAPSPTVKNVTGAVNQQNVSTGSSDSASVVGSNAPGSNTTTSNGSNSANNGNSTGSNQAVASGAHVHQSSSHAGSGSGNTSSSPAAVHGEARLAVRNGGVNAPAASCNGEVALSPMGGSSTPVCGHVNP